MRRRIRRNRKSRRSRMGRNRGEGRRRRRCRRCTRSRRGRGRGQKGQRAGAERPFYLDDQASSVCPSQRLLARDERQRELLEALLAQLALSRAEPEGVPTACNHPSPPGSAS